MGEVDVDSREIILDLQQKLKISEERRLFLEGQVATETKRIEDKERTNAQLVEIIQGYSKK